MRFSARESRLANIAFAGLLVTYLFFIATSIRHGTWLVDSSGRPLDGDFTCFWAAARVAIAGHPLDVYHWDALVHVLQPLVSKPIHYHYPFFYPPVFLLMLLPLGLLSYAWALMVWLLATLLLYLAAAYSILPNKLGWRFALIWPGCFWAVAVGQNGLLTAALFGLGTALLRTRPWIAGICFGLLALKPQLGLFIPLVLLLDWQWRAIAGAGATVVVGIAASGLVFGWEIFPTFFAAIQQAQRVLIEEGGLAWYHIQSWYGVAKYLGLDNASAGVIQLMFSLISALLLVLLWRSKADYSLKAAGLPLATLSALHYICIYDFPIIAITILWLMRSPALKPLDLLFIGMSFFLTLIQLTAEAPVGTASYILLAVVIYRLSRFTNLRGSEPINS